MSVGACFVSNPPIPFSVAKHTIVWFLEVWGIKGPSLQCTSSGLTGYYNYVSAVLHAADYIYSICTGAGEHLT